MAVPGATFANAILVLGGKTLTQLEHFQDEIGRWALGANNFTAKEAVQGDMGWSSFEAREAKSKIGYYGRLKLWMMEELRKKFGSTKTHGCREKPLGPGE